MDKMRHPFIGMLGEKAVWDGSFLVLLQSEYKSTVNLQSKGFQGIASIFPMDWELGPVEISKKYSEPKTKFYENVLIETENRITEYY